MTPEQLYQYMIDNDLRFASLEEPGWAIVFVNEDGEKTSTWVTDTQRKAQ